MLFILEVNKDNLKFEFKFLNKIYSNLKKFIQFESNICFIII